jgi:hypothetical protein
MQEGVVIFAKIKQMGERGMRPLCSIQLPHKIWPHKIYVAENIVAEDLVAGKIIPQLGRRSSTPTSACVSSLISFSHAYRKGIMESVRFMESTD